VHLNQEYALQVAVEGAKILEGRLEGLTDKEVRELDKLLVTKTIATLKMFLNLFDPEQTARKAESLELKVAERCLKSAFFEKRVKGLNELKEMYWRVRNSANKDFQPKVQWLTLERLGEWLEAAGILEFVFLENPHDELIKRSADVVRGMAQGGALKEEHVALIWSCARGDKHENVVRATYELVSELSLHLHPNFLEFFYLKIQGIRDADFDEKTVAFLKTQTQNTLKNLERRKVAEMQQQKQSMGYMQQIRGKAPVFDSQIDESKYVDLLKFWVIFQDDNKVSKGVKDLALASLVEILKEKQEANDSKQLLLELALTNLQKKESVKSTIIFMKELFSTYPLQPDN